MPTGTAMHYVSGSGTDHVDLPRGDGGYRKPHTQREPKPAGLDWDAIAPTCKQCGGHSATVSFRTGLCAVCDPPVAKKPPKEEKQGKPTTRRSAPRARTASSVHGTPGRAPGAGPSTTQGKNPAAVQETRPAAAAGPPAISAPPDIDLELGRELARAARLLSDSADHPSPAVQAIRGRVLGVLDSLEVLLAATRDVPQTSPQPKERPTAATPESTTGAARHATPRAAESGRPRAARSTPRDVDHNAVVAEYQAGDSVPVIAARHGVWPSRIRTILDRRRIPRRDDRRVHSGGRNAKTLADYPPELVDQIRRLYVDEAKTTSEVGDIVGHSAKYVTKILELAGIPRRPSASTPGRKGRNQKLDDTARAEICRRYADGESSLALAAAFDVSSPTILTAVRAGGGQVRSPSDAWHAHHQSTPGHSTTSTPQGDTA